MPFGGFHIIGQKGRPVEARRIYGAFTTRASDARKQLIADTVQRLKDAHLWSKLDLLHVLAAASSDAALVNWKNPGTFSLTAVNSPTFTADRGYTGDGSTSYLTTGTAHNALTAALQDSMHYGGWITGGTDSASSLAPLAGNAATMLLFPRAAGDGITAYVGSASPSVLGTSITTNQGHTVVNRSGASATEGYRNGAQTGTDTEASAARSAATILLLRSSSAYASFRLGAFHMGAGLTAVEHARLYGILRRYMQSVGAA